MKPPRFNWHKPSDLPDRVELVDSLNNRSVAVVIQAGEEWSWKRNTLTLIHGAPGAEGLSDSLLQAKIKVLEGLHNE
ncbi:hypothetical protein [Anatilimnocola floriformis]|uniref:hypothetical protein n=1 Tax=Anatilimnocola floriformis TaxID=2948575 RepID=UPI0020C3F395|nr:hypothetical protein [Anatilimnocola floriformis]